MKEKYKYQNARILSKKNLKVVRKVKKMTRQFFLLLTMILLASGSNFAQQETQKSISNEVDVLPESKDVYGTYVGSFNGVNAYSNGYNDYVSNVYNYETGINTGMKWQCVEYVNRYHYETYGTNIRVAGHNAEDYYSNASQHGLTAFANGGSEAPKVGDILCSNADPWGHVAIIREVSSSSITVIHQNWANSSIDNAKVISRSGNYISGFNASYSVQGWLRNSNSESFAANYSNQASFPTVAPGETNNWWVEFENTGTETWYNTGSNRIRLGSGTFSNPDQLFDITNSSWNSSYRPTDLDQSNINPGGIGRFTFSFTVPSNAQAGWSQEYHFTPLVESVEWMKQDDGQEINCFMKYYVEDGVTGLPDYVVSQYEVVSGLGTYQQGEDISLECTVSNVGDGDADHGIHVGYYLSQSPDGTDYYLEDDYCGRLDVGEDTEEDVIVAIPSNVPDGDYYVVFYANNEDEDPESNENNNKESAGPITIGNGGGGLPDYVVSQYEVVSGLGTYQQGEDISLECTVSNVGDGDADHGIHVGYYLSQSPDGTDYYLEDDYCGRLDVGEDTEEDVIVAIPSNVPDGDYYVVFYANNEDEDPESNENNNKESAGPITIGNGGGGLPDYVVSQYEVVSGLGTYQQGEDISLECTVSNVGDGDADHGIHVGYYLSQSPDGTDYYLEDDYCGRLDVGEDTEEDVIVAIPSNVPDGDYYVVFYANNEDEDPESNYNNNIESIGGITIGGIPQISLSTTIHDFGNITENDCSSVYNFTLTNTGTATANGSISLTGGNSSHFEITTGGGIFNLPAGQNRTIGVRFCPDNPGYKYATLDVNGTAPCNDVQATVEGIGIAIPDPVISVAPSTLDFEEVIIGESLTKNYLLTGSNLTANVTILAPSGYQVSLSSSSGFSTAIVAYQSGGNISETIYVKFSPTSAQSYNGNVSNSSAGAATKNVQLTGIGIPEPEIPTVSILSPEEGQTIPMQYIDVSGTANDADGTVTQVQIRLNSGIWQTVSGTTTWSMVDAGPLVVGSNTIEARSKDNDSQYSEISEVTFTHNDVCAPDWEPATSQQYNMQVIAQLYIDDVLSTNSNDMLGAFVDGECRGTASPIVGNPNGLIFLTITSNISEGEIVTFKGWNSDICEECSLFETITFVNQDEIGTIPNPEPFHCGLIDFCLDFEDGYTWFSVNVNPGSFEWNSLFEGLSPCNNDRIIGQGGFASYSDGQWYYSPVIFPELLPNKMYIMKLCNSQQWCIQGQQVAIEPIDLSSGWTWLGYLPQEELAINEAIGIDPAPANDDRFVGQNAFSAYYGTQWIGQLMQLNIGEGYKIKLTNEGTLSYPGSLTKNVGGENATKVFNPLQVPYKSNKKYSMNIIAKLLLPDGSYSTNPFDAIYAFHENECCGIASPIENSDGLYMLSIGSNFDQGEEIDLIAYDDFSQEVSKIEETIVFNTYTEAGTVNNPVEYTVSGVSTNINFGDKHQSTTSLEAFPNPFDHEMKIHLSLEFSGQVQAYIKNVHGQKVLQLEDATMLRAGNHTYDIHETNLNPGVYYCIFEITTTSGKHLETMKIIKL